MNRREFLGAASAAVFAPGLRAAQAGAPTPMLKPMALGLLISPFGALEERIKRVRDLGFSTCFLSLDGYLGHFTSALAAQFRDLLEKYELIATTVEVVGPGERVWDFLRGPSTIGLVPRPRARRASTRCGRLPISRNCSTSARYRPIAASFPRILQIPSIPEQWKPFAPLPSTARRTGSTSDGDWAGDADHHVSDAARRQPSPTWPWAWTLPT